MQPTPSNPYPTQLDKFVRILTILSRKAKAHQTVGDITKAATYNEIQFEIQNLCITEFGITAGEIRSAVSKLKGQ